jgi:hypothetical protein
MRRDDHLPGEPRFEIKQTTDKRILQFQVGLETWCFYLVRCMKCSRIVRIPSPALDHFGEILKHEKLEEHISRHERVCTNPPFPDVSLFHTCQCGRHFYEIKTQTWVDGHGEITPPCFRA